MDDVPPRLTQEQRAAHDLARRREVLDLPSVPLRQHGRLLPPRDAGSPELGAVGIGPAGDAAAAWCDPAERDRFLVTLYGTSGGRPTTGFDAVFEGWPDFVQPLPGGRSLLVSGRARGDEANAGTYGPAGEPEAGGHVGDAVAHVLATASGEVWVGYFDEAAALGEGLGGHGLVRFSPELEPVWRYPQAELLPYIIDCYALNVDGERVAICAYDEWRLVTVEGDAATDRGEVPHDGAYGLLVAGDRAALIGGYGPEYDLVTPLRIGPDGTVRDGPASRLVLAGGDELAGYQVVCRGADLHVLIRGEWYRTDLERLLAV